MVKTFGTAALWIWATVSLDATGAALVSSPTGWGLPVGLAAAAIWIALYTTHRNGRSRSLASLRQVES